MKKARYSCITIKYRLILKTNPHDNLKSKSTNLLKLKTKLIIYLEKGKKKLKIKTIESLIFFSYALIIF